MKNHICQLCNQNHPNYSVESIYFAIIAQDRENLNEMGITKSHQRLNEFSPPLPPKKPLWARFSPDNLMLFVLMVFLLIPLLLTQNLSLNQAMSLVVLFLVYILFRNKLLSWYQSIQKADQEHQDAYKIEINQWQKKVYCPIRDETYTPKSQAEL